MPDAPCAVPAETEAVVERLIRHLAPLLDTANDMDELDPIGPADSALVRLTSSEALLRLARLHDARLHPEVFLALALTMQVRIAFSRGNNFHASCFRQPAQFALLLERSLQICLGAQGIVAIAMYIALHS